MARKYHSNGNPNGGKRDGAGRKAGTKNALALGEVAATKAAGLRVPESATPAQRALADRALQRIAAVMEERVGGFASTAVLKAATHIREEICGAVKQKIEHSGFDTLTDEQLEARFRAAQALVGPATSISLPQGVGPTESAVPGNGADLGPEGDVS